MSLFGRPSVDKLLAKGNVHGLVEALHHGKNREVRRAAATALGELGDPQAVAGLVAALGDTDDVVGRAAAAALGRIGDSRAVQPLIGALARSALRAAAIGALTKIGTPAVEPVLAVLVDPDRDQRWEAAEVLGRIGDRRAVQPLIDILRSSGPGCSATVLGKLGDTRAIEPLVEALSRRNQRIRDEAAEALFAFGSEAVSLLIRALDDKDRFEPAVRILGRIGDQRAVEPLVAMLGDQNRHVRRAAADALDTLGWQPGRDEKGARYHVARRAWNRCADIGSPAIGTLEAALRDPDRKVRAGAARALGSLGWQPGHDETGARYCVARGDWDQCVQIGTDAVGPLTAALKYLDSCAPAARALGQLSDPGAAEALVAVITDPGMAPKPTPAHTVITGDPFAQGLRVPVDAAQPHDVREVAAEALVMLGAAAVDPLITALRTADHKVRDLVVRTLSRIGDPRAAELGAVTPLIDSLKDSSYTKRRQAASWLDTLGWVPDRGRAGAAYWAALGDLDKCAEIGAPAVEPLIHALAFDEDVSWRVDVAQALVDLYQSGSLGPEESQAILRRRSWITQRHQDENHHARDDDWHTDRGIGVDFPL